MVSCAALRAPGVGSSAAFQATHDRALRAAVSLDGAPREVQDAMISPPSIAIVLGAGRQQVMLTDVANRFFRKVEFDSASTNHLAIGKALRQLHEDVSRLIPGVAECTIRT